MICQRIALPAEGACLDTFFLSRSREILNSHRHSAVIICPGGAYSYLSDREAEPIALAFAARGFSAAVLRYPCAPARFPSQLCAAAQGLAWVRSHGPEYNIDPQQIFLAGFSAGGHLTASLGVFWDQAFLSRATGLTPEQMRPDRLILSYPVITSGPHISRETFRNLLGEKLKDPNALTFQSLETHVTAATPPTFLWHTVADQEVPVESSMLFAMALQKHKVPFEAHLFSAGPHGLALASHLTENPEHLGLQPECSCWIDLAADWLRRELPK